MTTRHFSAVLLATASLGLVTGCGSSEDGSAGQQAPQSEAIDRDQQRQDEEQARKEAKQLQQLQESEAEAERSVEKFEEQAKDAEESAREVQKQLDALP